MPRGGNLSQYRGPRDWGTRGDAQRAMYDLCRDSQMGHEQALLHAEAGASRLAAEAGDGEGPQLAVPMGVVPEAARRLEGRSMFRTPYFGPHAGRRCRVLEDGTLEPVE